jgi:thiamine-monophosphate kinase
VLGEFALIDQFFKRAPQRAVLGVGDDCALVEITKGQQLAVTTDMLVEGRHFFKAADPYRLGWKCLAVNLSDLAAMGAQPRYFTLSLAVPSADAAWLAPFSKGLFALADAHGMELIGGDTTAGPLTISITALGEVPPGHALTRSGAQPSDEIWLSHEIGGAVLRLNECWERTTLTPTHRQALLQRMEAPEPRVALGLALRGIASAAIDLSDGLSGDLGHLLRASRVGATVRLADIPTHEAVRNRLQTAERALAIQCLLAGGDDYELIFTAPASAHETIGRQLQALSLSGGVIGTIQAGAGLTALDEFGAALPLPKSFDHFSA